MVDEEKAKELAMRLKGDIACPECGSKKLLLVSEIKDALYISESGGMEIEPDDFSERLENVRPIDRFSVVRCPKCGNVLDEEFVRVIRQAYLGTT